jgi:hypothetical protein
MSEPRIERDERTTVIENASYRLAYLFLSFGVLLAVMYRAFALQDAHSWDLLGLVIASGAVTTGYQGAHKVLSRRWLVTVLTTMMMAALIGAAILYLKR